MTFNCGMVSKWMVFFVRRWFEVGIYRRSRGNRQFIQAMKMTDGLYPIEIYRVYRNEYNDLLNNTFGGLERTIESNVQSFQPFCPLNFISTLPVGDFLHQFQFRMLFFLFFFTEEAEGPSLRGTAILACSVKNSTHWLLKYSMSHCVLDTPCMIWFAMMDDIVEYVSAHLPWEMWWCTGKPTTWWKLNKLSKLHHMKACNLGMKISLSKPDIWHFLWRLCSHFL